MQQMAAARWELQDIITMETEQHGNKHLWLASEARVDVAGSCHSRGKNIAQHEDRITRATALTGRSRPFAGRTRVAAQMRWPSREGEKMALSLIGLASMLMTATWYTSTTEAETPKTKTSMRSIGRIANRVFD